MRDSPEIQDLADMVGAAAGQHHPSNHHLPEFCHLLIFWVLAAALETWLHIHMPA
jgi:hypothetical protein